MVVNNDDKSHGKTCLKNHRKKTNPRLSLITFPSLLLNPQRNRRKWNLLEPPPVKFATNFSLWKHLNGVASNTPRVKSLPHWNVFVSVDIFFMGGRKCHGSCPVAPYGVMGLVDPVGDPGGRLPGHRVWRMVRWKPKKFDIIPLSPWFCCHPDAPCGCFLKWWYPQNTPKWSFSVGKLWLLGTTIHVENIYPSVEYLYFPLNCFPSFCAFDQENTRGTAKGSQLKLSVSEFWHLGPVQAAKICRKPIASLKLAARPWKLMVVFIWKAYFQGLR